MNNNAIDLCEKILYRAAVENIKKYTRLSSISLGIFAASRLMIEENQAMICIALSEKFKYLSNCVLASGFISDTIKSFVLIKDFSLSCNAKKIAVAMNYKVDNDESFLMKAVEANNLSESLANIGIDLVGFFLTNKADFENII